MKDLVKYMAQALVDYPDDYFWLNSALLTHILFYLKDKLPLIIDFIPPFVNFFIIFLISM